MCPLNEETVKIRTFEAKRVRRLIIHERVSVSLYYLAGTVFSLGLGFPFACPAAALGLVLVGAGPKDVWAVASCEALRRMAVVAVLGGSTGTVGVRTDRGWRDGQTL